MFLISVRSNRCVKKLLKKIYGYCGKWTKRCVKKLLKKIHMHWNMSLISENIMPKKCLKRLLKKIYSYCGVRPQWYVKELLKRKWLLEYIPSQCITQELRRWGGEEKRFALPYVFNQYMTQETCERAVEKDPWWLKNHWKIFLISIRPPWYVKEMLKRKRLLKYIPNQCITQELRRWGGEEKRFALPYVFNQYMTQETCERAVEKDPWWLKNHWKIFLISIRPRWYVKELLKRKRLLEYIPDQCITQEILKELLKKLLVIERYYESA